MVTGVCALSCGGELPESVEIEFLSHRSGEGITVNDRVKVQASASALMTSPNLLIGTWTFGGEEVCTEKAFSLAGLSKCKFTPDTPGPMEVRLEVRAPAIGEIPERRGSATLELMVEVPRGTPRCEILAPLEGGGFSDTHEVRFQGKLEEVTGDCEGLELVWRSDLDGHLGQGETNEGCKSTIKTSDLSVGEHHVTLNLDAGYQGSCEATVTLFVETAPEVDIAKPLAGEAFLQAESIPWSASVTGSSGQYTCEWHSDVEGLLDSRRPGSQGQMSGSFQGLSGGSHALVLHCTSEAGIEGSAQVNVVIDGWPGAPEIQLLPNTPLESDDMSVQITVESQDPEGQTVSYQVVWHVDGVLFREGTDTDISAQETSLGEEWTVKVTPSDGAQDGPGASAAVTIGGFLDWSDVDMPISDADITLFGAQEDDQLGAAIAGGCDLDGDGFDELIVSAPYNDEAGSNSGRTYLFLGGALSPGDSLDIDSPDYALPGEVAADYSGTALDCGGDVDGDGLEDLLVGAPGHDKNGSGSGRAYLLSGADFGTSAEIDLSDAHASLSGESASDEVGSVVAGGQDVDGDGFDDLLLATWLDDEGGTFAGKTYLVLGADVAAGGALDLSDAALSLIGEEGDRSGFSADLAGDVDTDGYADLLIGAHGVAGEGEYAGRAYVVLGSMNPGASAGSLSLGDADFEILAESAQDYSGYRVSRAGDVDGDQRADVLVGAIGAADLGAYTGRSYLVTGASLGGVTSLALGDADHIFLGEESGDYSGWAFGGGGDIDGDGLDDLLIGAPYFHGQVSEGGKAYLFYAGSLGGSQLVDLSDADHGFYGVGVDEHLGSALPHGGDLNGDGLDDVILGSPGSARSGADDGAVSVFFSPNAAD